MGKTLIAYYSRRGKNYVNGSIENLPKGNTEVIAEKIKALLPDADVYRIDTTYEYPKDYYECIDQAKAELRAKARPELKNPIDGIEDYDTIILGYPNWWGTMPMVVYTFLERFDFAGKRIVPYCTNEGSGMGGSVRTIQRMCPGATVTAGTSIHGAEVQLAGKEVKEIVKLANQ